ncbi:tyrosine/serine/threonine protein phosphatase PPS1 [Saccharomyces paradoxus]|uniref:Tyrosine/serine/threonine protein phosphatase PPS1 n=1 Tax=Saccharomyces paradoxus TaxID=27291 RepID=A0A8B8UM43_SACPA|nr:Pps1 [Saccharomyces paradoxus]QHS71833.1 Pps1 [Saccharomyces paradoxus]
MVLEVPSITPGELHDLMRLHQSAKWPECKKMFPWAHDISFGQPPDFPHSLAIVKSQSDASNSALLRSSLEVNDIFQSWKIHTSFHREGGRCATDNELDGYHYPNNTRELLKLLKFQTRQLELQVDDVDLENAATYCHDHSILPFLKVDPRGLSLELKRDSRNKVGSSTVLKPSRQDVWGRRGLFRRFDLQCAKMIEMVDNIVIYCTRNGDTTNTQGDSAAMGSHEGDCPNCTTLALLLRICLMFVQKGYAGCEGSLYKTNLSICTYRNFNTDIPQSLIGTPLLDKIFKNTPLNLSSSPSEIECFNNIDKNMVLCEKLELNKLTSATRLEETGLICGNTTDWHNYQIIKKSNIPLPDRSQENASIVTLRPLTYDPDNPTASISRLYNVPNTKETWKLIIKCTSNSSMPLLTKIRSYLDFLLDDDASKSQSYLHLTFPASGTIGLGNLNIQSVEILLNVCFLIFQVSQVQDQFTFMYCSDGYTETSLLLTAYIIFHFDIPLQDALLRIHPRPFFLFPSDLQILGHLQPILREFSPQRGGNLELYSNAVKFRDRSFQLHISSELFSSIFFMKIPPESNFVNLKGPLPSRILQHLYLGSLDHAQNPDLLKSLGITHIVSVGEVVSWTLNREKVVHPVRPHRAITMTNTNEVMGGAASNKIRNRAGTTINDRQENGSNIVISENSGFQICQIENLDDNGKDPLFHQIDKVLDFISNSEKAGGKVLVHCMVGVSRSATVCIAECMRYLHCDLASAYLFVRVRRLNVIIQPNLFFVYELFKWWKKHYNYEKDKTMDWHIICRGIAEVNMKYT